MLRRLLGKETGKRISDGFRGRPDVDLSGYAESRGLAFSGQSGFGGYLGAFAIAAELQWNVMRGVLPGGRHGVLFHHVAILDPDSAGGTFYGKKTENVGGFNAADLIPIVDLFTDNIRFFRLPETKVAFRLPASVPSVVRFHVARRGERARASKSTNFLAQRELGHDAWRLRADDRTDLDLLERIVQGPLGAVLAREQALGFTVEYAFGQLFVRRQDFLAEPDELDAFCRQAVELADGIAALDPPGPLPSDFDAPLRQPEWLAWVQQRLDERHIDVSSSAWLEPLVRYARDHGMGVEDPFAFHTAFAALPVPGRAFAVAAGPGIRIASACERQIVDIEPYKREWPDAGLTIGCDMVLLPTGGRDTDDPDGVKGDGVRYAVRDGVLLVSAIRPRYQFSPEPMDELIAKARALSQTLGP